MTKINPQEVLIGTPTHDGSVVAEYAGGIATSVGLYAGLAFEIGCSNVMLARASQVEKFLSTKFEYLVSIDADIGFTRRDFEFLLEGDEDLVCAEYSKKDGSGNPAQLGLGFARIHRRVFDKMLNLKFTNVSGQETPMIETMRYQGRVLDHFFPTGSSPQGDYVGEDWGFFKYAEMAHCTLRVETRTRLQHIGRHAYLYPNPVFNVAANLPRME